MADKELQSLPLGRSRPPDVKFWEDFVLFGMPGRDLVFYYTDCSNNQYWDMNVFLMTQLLTTVKCCGRCVWAFSRIVKPFQHADLCDWTNILNTVQDNVLLAFPWMNSKRASEFWLHKIFPDYIMAQARCLELKWRTIDPLVDPDRKETTFCLSYGTDIRKPSHTTWVSLLELGKGDLPTVNPDGTLKLASLSTSAILQRMPYGIWGQLNYADSFWNLMPVNTDDEIRRVIQSEYDAGHTVFYLHMNPPAT